MPIERVIYATLLGVWFQEDLGMKEHVNNLMLLCNQRTYLITQLKRQGLRQKQLQNVFDAIIVSRLLNAAPVWRGYLSLQKLIVCRVCWIKLMGGN